MNLDSIAADFFHVFYEKEWLGDEEDRISRLSIADAYKVQDLVTEKRIEAGESIAGFKVGCTSAAIHEQFGLDEPINAKLFRPHIFEGSVTLDWRDYINCAIEPEMVLKIGKDLKGDNLSDEELIDGIDYVSPGIEVHNFKFWNAVPTIQELICSGGIHAGLMVGEARVSPKNLLFQDEIFAVYKNGIETVSAPASEIMGGPLHSLRWLVKFLTGKGLILERHSLVIPGSPVELVPIDRDTELRVSIEGLGSLSAHFQQQTSG